MRNMSTLGIIDTQRTHMQLAAALEVHTHTHTCTHTLPLSVLWGLSPPFTPLGVVDGQTGT